MKKVNLKTFLMTLSVALAFLFVGVGQAGAQSQATTINASGSTGGSVGNNPKSLMVPPTGNFLSVAEALGILENYNASLKAQLETLPQGTSTYAAVEKEYAYFEGIYNALLKGFSVPEAIVEGMYVFSDAFGPVSTAAKLTLKQSAISKLSA